ncbi:transcriptional regulator [Streptomyces spiralis]|uniref:Transcriptional regulator n=1 Tax=Streptomyces spiralis TaxID=66376 RepID=A0A919E1Q3_9ACTN|nr:helix-turn-helix transcriptional regulator [Streptomyces spiralis]GHF02067.1 transcriptional regulator [Streptomyces spiralis]
MCHPAWRQAQIAAQHLLDLARLRRVRDRIGRQYTQPLDVEALAREAGMAPGRLSRQFRDAYGQSPYAYVMTLRVEQAMALLRHGEAGVGEVCRAVGCPSAAAFTTRFTELAGMEPGLYRSRAALGTAGLPWHARAAVPVSSRNEEAPASTARLA